ncbi:MAG: FtsX-like permease family protein [Acidobacteria bacterium]|nr:FtsX-like permease family protein [Acidobacteriota bacterium]
MTALDRLAALPGVRSASLSSYTLISGSASMSVAALPGVLAPEPGSAAAAAFFRSHSTWRLVVDDRFFETMGLYGLLAYSIARRTAEIGIRMALGAERRAMRWMVMRQSLRLVVVGVALGIPAAIWGTRLLDTMLFGLSPSDPVTFAQAAGLMLAVSAVAAYVPARRAARVDPLVALRAE